MGRRAFIQNPRNYSQGSQAETAGEALEVEPARLRPNPWNYNVLSAEQFGKLCTVIREFGFIGRVVTRDGADGALEIVDGEHRWRAAIELEMASIPIVHLGQVSDEDAQQLTVILNELGGQPDEVRLADLVRNVSLKVDLDRMRGLLPFTPKQLDLLIKGIDFSFSKAPGEDTRPPGAEDDQDELEEVLGPPTPGEEAAKPQKRVRLALALEPEAAETIKAQLAQIHEDPVEAVRIAVEYYLQQHQPKRGKRRKAVEH